MILSWFVVRNMSGWNIVLFLLSHFLILLVTPLFLRSENLWMFCILSVTTLPINLRLLAEAAWGIDFFDENPVLGVVRCLVFLGILFSAEQLVMGLLTRLIWQRQRKL